MSKLKHLGLAVGVANALTPLEASVFQAWAGVGVGYGFDFSEVAERSGVDRHKIRRAVRALARKGAVEYCRTMYCEDDHRIFAGYMLTPAGAQLLEDENETLL